MRVLMIVLWTIAMPIIVGLAFVLLGLLLGGIVYLLAMFIPSLKEGNWEGIPFMAGILLIVLLPVSAIAGLGMGLHGELPGTRKHD